MKTRSRDFSLDMPILVFSMPVLIVIIALARLILFIASLALSNPAISAATSVALTGSILLFRAKLPGFRAGIFNQAGSRRLPAASRKLYRQAYALIIPGCFALAVLCVKFATE